MAELHRDPVFSALTRLQMFAGVTYSYFVLNAVATIELFLITHSFWVLPVCWCWPSTICCLKSRVFSTCG